MKNVKYVKWRDRWRIVWAITRKDILEAWKNKTILTQILVVAFLIAYDHWAPALRDTPTDLFIYDPGNSQGTTQLADTPQFRLIEADTEQRLIELMDEADPGEIGLILPADFDRALATGKAAPALRGYVNWADRFEAAALARDFETRLAALWGQPVQLVLADHVVRPQPDTLGIARGSVAMMLSYAIFMLGVFMVSHLMFEEKQTQTLQALLVSPASIGQIIAGKALTGMFYCTAAAGVVLALKWVFVIHWELMLLAVLCGALFNVALGLLFGTFLENRQQMMIWAFIPIVLLLIPVFLNVIEPLLPQGLGTLIAGLPTVALATLFRFACTDGAPLARILGHLSLVLGSTALLLGLVVWKVRRMDR